jgi:hypothetical protein
MRAKARILIKELSMSSTHLATAPVAPFEHLRMTDVEAVGGKNASLGEMISQLASSGVRVPGGFATTADAFRRFLAAGRPRRAHRRPSCGRWTWTTCALAWPPARAIRQLGDGRAVARPTWRRRCARSSRGCPPTARRCPSRCAPRPRPRTCPTPPSPASRRPS